MRSIVAEQALPTGCRCVCVYECFSGERFDQSYQVGFVAGQFHFFQRVDNGADRLMRYE